MTSAILRRRHNNYHCDTDAIRHYCPWEYSPTCTVTSLFKVLVEFRLFVYTRIRAKECYLEVHLCSLLGCISLVVVKPGLLHVS